MGESSWEERLAAALSSVPGRLQGRTGSRESFTKGSGTLHGRGPISPPEPLLGPVLGDTVGRAGCRGLAAEEQSANAFQQRRIYFR